VSNPTANSCRNCGASLVGPYCSRCGQRDIDYHQSIGTVFRDFLDSFLAFDGKVIQTLWLLLSRPGELTLRFLEGQQIRFLNPIRFYVSVSLVFFLVLHFAQPNTALVVVKGDVPAGHDANAASNEQTAGEDQQFEAKMIKKYESEQEFGSHLAAEFIERLQWMILICVPIYAGLLKLVYLRSKRPYLAHLVFAFHLHSAFFVCALLQTLLNAISKVPHLDWVKWAVGLLGLWLVVYLFLAQRRVYGQSLGMTALKFVALYFGYIVVLLIAVTVTGTLVFYLTTSA
jgi:Protein of unknown function (DUF3667)